MKAVTNDYHPSNRGHFSLSVSAHNNLCIRYKELIKIGSCLLS